ncbi:MULTISPECIES: MocR-like pyridoxine biosynthesis transcription factor PdxR [Amycolatopsis]|uniref:PLP-dependent aminotransferase family protein n=1 Tax=Amycolatopsis dendrobii TaxID=2760662 RepID=A0A7W3W1K3_9PSEU|nr:MULTISPECIES: PLP-dependent aminotransferase family protein [Amycolatopsis]MBB1157075.1 PLP-dependent aminotransferase family protein [Amycolatopsis dendrobii]UKD59529.1 PLP-dependent aminotransferase family protein [Amycolatopsis sp. FU40]
MKRASAADGLDLYLPVSTTRPAHALETALRAAVVDGRLPVGTRLPASRALATDLGIARSTVSEVYSRLAAEGWLESRVGAGTWIAGFPRQAQPAAKQQQSPPEYELRGGLADAGDFPRSQWSAQTRRALSEMPVSAFAYAPPEGVPELRDTLAGYLARTRGVTAGDIVIGSGFGDLLSLTCRSIRARGGKRIAVEEYGHERHRRIIAESGLDIVAIPVDAEGADLAGTKADAVFLTPAHQFPTGVPLSPERRRAAVEWANARDALILEDDYDGEFRYDRRSIGALQALAPDRVVYLGTSSKALAPAVGVAWAVAPPDLLPELLRQRNLSGVTPSGLHQQVLARFLDSHEYDRAVRRRRATFRTRRELFARLLAERTPDLRPGGLAAGLQCLVELPDTAAEERTLAAARQFGVALEGLAGYRAPGGDPDRAGVVIGYGAVSSARAARALSLAADALANGLSY